MDSSDEEEMRRLRSSATYATAAEERRRHRRCAAAALDSNDPRLSRSLASSQNRASRVSSSSSSDDDAFGPSPPKPFPGGERQGAAAGALLERAASTPSSEDEDPDALCRAVLPEELEAAGLPSCFGGRPSFSVARACAGKGSGGGPRCTDSAAARSGRWVSLKAHFSRPLKELCGAGEGGEETLASLPVVAEFALHLHSPGLATAFALAPKGNRMVTGGSDGALKFWDFHGMLARSRRPQTEQSYRTLAPVERHRVASVAWGLGGFVAVASGDSVCRLYTAEGEALQSTTKGDLYVRDLAQTKGHTHAVQDVAFHPLQQNLFATASLDASVRLWDLNSAPYGLDQTLTQIHTLKAVDRRGANSGACSCTCCLYTPTSGNAIVAGCADGSLQLWGSLSSRKVFTRPDSVVRNAHSPPGVAREHSVSVPPRRFGGLAELSGDGGVCAIAFASDERRMLSRGLDGSACLWDLRRFSSPVRRWSSLPVEDARAGVCFSAPDERFVLVTTQRPAATNRRQELGEDAREKLSGSAAPRLFRDHLRKTQSGELLAFCAVSGEEAFRIEWKEKAPTAVQWHAGTGQLFLGCTDGSVAVCFDPEGPSGKEGAALLALQSEAFEEETRAARERRDFETHQALMELKPENIFTPDALPEGLVETFDGRLVQKRLKPKQRQEQFEATQKTKLPPIPSKRGMNGQPGAVGNSSLHLLRTLNLVPAANAMPGKVEEVAGAEPLQRVMDGVQAQDRTTWTSTFISRAYAKTAPRPVIDFSEEQQDDADKLLTRNKRCAKCGLRCCQCEDRSNKQLRL